MNARPERIEHVDLAKLRRLALEIRTTHMSLRQALDELEEMDELSAGERRLAVRRWCEKARRSMDEVSRASERSRAALDETIAQVEAHAERLRHESEEAIRELQESLGEARSLVTDVDRTA